MRTSHATLGTIRGRVLLGEKPQISHARNADARLADIPNRKAQIMAAFRHDHRRRVLRPMPVAAHVGMGIVPMRHVLGCVYSRDFAVRTRIEFALDRRKEIGVTQNMTNKYLAPELFRDRTNLLARRHA